MMKRHGQISNIMFSRQGWDIYNMAIKYKIWGNGESKLVFVNSMMELKEEIVNYHAE